MEDKISTILKTYHKISETTENIVTITIKNPMEELLAKKYSDRFNLKKNRNTLIKNFEENSRKLLEFGIKPKISRNLFLVYGFSTVEEGLEILGKNKNNEWEHKFIESDDKKCFICEEKEINHRSTIKKLLSRRSLENDDIQNLNRNRKLNSNLNYNNNFFQFDDNYNSFNNYKRQISKKELFLKKNYSSTSLDFKSPSNKNIKKKLYLSNPFKDLNIKINENKEKDVIYIYNNIINTNKIDNFNKENIQNINQDNKKEEDICLICFDNLNDEKKVYLNCKDNFCKECLQEYLKEEIKNSRVLELKCPQKICIKLLDKEFIEKYTEKDIFLKYKKFLIREKYKNNLNMINCPILNCEGYAQINEKENNNKNNKIDLINLISEREKDKEKEIDKEKDNDSKGKIISFNLFIIINKLNK
jgi:hypothetical protein